MVLSAIIVILFVLAIMWGWRHGLIETAVSVGGYLLILVVAYLLNAPLAAIFYRLLPKTNSLSHAFANCLAFWTVLICGGILLRATLAGLHWIVALPLLSQLNAVLGAILAASAMYSLIYFGLVLLSVYPNHAITKSVKAAPIAVVVLHNSPQQLASLIHVTNIKE